MGKNTIALEQNGVVVRGLELRHPDVVQYFSTIDQDELEVAFVRAVEVGTFCLQRASTCNDFDFVRRQVDALLGAVEKTVLTMPSQVESALLARIGTADGQVLAPIQTLVNNSVKASADRLNELRAAVNEVDPSRDGSATSKVLHSLKDLLDPRRNDSVQSAIATAVTAITSSDGALVKAVQGALSAGLTPLREEIDRLAKEVRGQEAAAEALSQTTAKGFCFEEDVVSALQPWARAVGAQIEHVGGDNQAGDVVITLPTVTSFIRIALELKDRQTAKGRKAISDMVAAMMEARAATAAIYVSRDRQGLANEIGDWAEGECSSGPFVACTMDHLVTALRFVVVQHRINSLKAERSQLDAPSILAQVNRMKTTIDRVKNLNRKSNEIRGCAGDIEAEACLLRNELRDALTLIEDLIRANPSPAPAPATVELISAKTM